MAAADPDAGDVAASLRGEEQAYARLLGRHQAGIAAQMWRFTREPGQHAELVQEVFVQAYLSLATFRGDAPFVHWLRRLATHVGYRYWRTRDEQRARFAPLDDEQLAHLPAATPAGPSPEEAGALLQALLARLPVNDRLVLTLHYFEACSMADIAARMGWSEAAVKMRALRARQELRRLIAAGPYEELLAWTP